MPTEQERAHFFAQVNEAHDAFARRFPGDGGRRQPTHVVYGGMHLFTAQTPRKLGQLAQTQLSTYAPDAQRLGAIFELSDAVATEVFAKVTAKLRVEPIEDYRIDSEDGYGHRSDQEEDEHALAAGRETRLLFREGTPPPFFGLRLKPLSKELAPRALQTLERFLDGLTGGEERAVPPGFLITLPKVTSAAQLTALAELLDAVERERRLEPGTFRLEAMIESGPGFLDDDGACALATFPRASKGRLFAAHLGAYDFTASLDVAAPAQSLTHVACDQLRQQMKLAFAGTGVFLSDGATTQLPLAPHKGTSLSSAQQAENERAVHQAWRAHAANVRHALSQGFYQGWDLHPGQLVPRFVATYAFFLEHRAAMTKRLANFIGQLGQATSVGTSFDDAATGQGLLNFFLRGASCGAFGERELSATGLTHAELERRDFRAVVAR